MVTHAAVRRLWRETLDAMGQLDGGHILPSTGVSKLENRSNPLQRSGVTKASKASKTAFASEACRARAAEREAWTSPNCHAVYMSLLSTLFLVSALAPGSAQGLDKGT